MWKLLWVIGALGAVAGLSAPAMAQDYPWCSNFADGAGTNCGFSTLDQCKAEILGSGGFCMANNLYKPPVGSVPVSRRAIKRHARKNS